MPRSLADAINEQLEELTKIESDEKQLNEETATILKRPTRGVRAARTNGIRPRRESKTARPPRVEVDV